MTPKNSANKVSAVVGGIVAVAAIWFYFGGGLERQAARDMAKIEMQVAEDAVKQYDIAKTSGSAMDRCVQAGFVAAAYLQAKDDANYKVWKQTESDECGAAGVPR